MANTHTRLIAGAIVIAGVAIGAAACSRDRAPLIQGAHPTKHPFTGAWSDTEATFTVRPDAGGVCELTGKDTEVEVAKGKKITWTVRNFCKADQTVTVGNFRIAEASAATDCSAATEGITWPFDSTDKNIGKRQATPKASNGTDPTEGAFKLNDASNMTGAPLKYHFDVCLGTGSGKKTVDPRLVIDP